MTGCSLPRITLCGVARLLFDAVFLAVENARRRRGLSEEEKRICVEVLQQWHAAGQPSRSITMSGYIAEGTFAVCERGHVSLCRPMQMPILLQPRADHFEPDQSRKPRLGCFATNDEAYRLPAPLRR
jgi:hypothetical protein